jgi:hypothetical protein
MLAWGCGAPLTTASQTPAALAPECAVVVDGDRARFEVSLAFELGDGDHFAARRGDGPLALLAPRSSPEITRNEAVAGKTYEIVVEGYGAPRLAWSRGDDPYQWVELPVPTEPALRFKKEPGTIAWAKQSGDRPVETRLSITCDVPAQMGACPSAAEPRPSGEPTACWSERVFAPAVESVPFAEIVAPKGTEADLSRCSSYRIIAKRVDRVPVTGLGLAANATCAVTTSSEIQFEKDR